MIRLDAGLTYAQAGEAVIAARTHDVFAHQPERVLSLENTEGVHKMRVATRRLRAALEIFADAFPRKRLAAALSDVKLLAAALGERRDLDVQIELLSSLSGQARRDERKAIDALIADLRHQQHIANEQLDAALEHAREANLERRLARLAK